MTDEIPRDRWGRPQVQPPGGGTPVPYTRISTLASVLDNQYALTRWKMRMVALGLQRRPDLAALVQTMGSGPEDRDRLDKICQEALVAADGESRANIGTALHSVTQMVDRGITDGHGPLQPEADAYLSAIEQAGLHPVASELFVVCDPLEAAGTFDRIYDLPDGRRLLADIKTGDTANTYGIRAVRIQTAVYARGTLYTAAKGRGWSLKDLRVSQTESLLIHLPAAAGTCTIYLLDQGVGWEDAKLAKRVHSLAALADKAARKDQAPRLTRSQG